MSTNLFDPASIAGAIAQAEAIANSIIGGGGQRDLTPRRPRSPFEDPLQENQFREWYQGSASRFNLDPDPDNPQHQYDYRRAYEAQAGPGEDGHWPSQFKLAQHPSRYIDGVDTISGQPDLPGQRRQDARASALREQEEQGKLQYQATALQNIIDGYEKARIKPTTGERFAGAVAPYLGLEAGGVQDAAAGLAETFADPIGASQDLAAGDALPPASPHGGAAVWRAIQQAATGGINLMAGLKEDTQYDVDDETFKRAQGELERRRSQGESIDMPQVLAESKQREPGPIVGGMDALGRILSSPMEAGREVLAYQDQHGGRDFTLGQQISLGLKGIGKGLVEAGGIALPQLAGAALDGLGQFEQEAARALVPDSLEAISNSIKNVLLPKSLEAKVPSAVGSIGQLVAGLGHAVRSGMGEAGRVAAAAGTAPPQETSPGIGIAQYALPDQPGAAMMLGMGLELALDPFLVKGAMGATSGVLRDATLRTQLLEKVGTEATRNKAFMARLQSEAAKVLRKSPEFSTGEIQLPPPAGGWPKGEAPKAVKLKAKELNELLAGNPKLAAEEGLIKPHDARRFELITRQSDRLSEKLGSMTDEQLGQLRKTSSGERFLDDMELYGEAMVEATSETSKARRVQKLAIAETIRRGAENRLRGSQDLVAAAIDEAKARNAPRSELDAITRFAQFSEEQGTLKLERAKTDFLVQRAESVERANAASARDRELRAAAAAGDAKAAAQLQAEADARIRAAMAERTWKEKLAARKARYGQPEPAEPAAAGPEPAQVGARIGQETRGAAEGPSAQSVLDEAIAAGEEPKLPSEQAASTPAETRSSGKARAKKAMPRAVANLVEKAEATRPTVANPEVVQLQDQAAELAERIEQASTSAVDPSDLASLQREAAEVAREIEDAQGRAVPTSAPLATDSAEVRARKAAARAAEVRAQYDQGSRKGFYREDPEWQRHQAEALQAETEATLARLERRGGPLAGAAPLELAGEPGSSARPDVGFDIGSAYSRDVRRNAAGFTGLENADEVTRARAGQLIATSQQRWAGFTDEFREVLRDMAPDAESQADLDRYGTFSQQRAMRKNLELRVAQMEERALLLKEQATGGVGAAAANSRREARRLVSDIDATRRMAGFVGQLTDPEAVFAAAGDLDKVGEVARADMEFFGGRLDTFLKEHQFDEAGQALLRDDKTGLFREPALADQVLGIAQEYDAALRRFEQTGPAEIRDVIDQRFASLISKLPGEIKAGKLKHPGKGLRTVLTEAHRDPGVALHESARLSLDRTRNLAQEQLKRATAKQFGLKYEASELENMARQALDELLEGEPSPASIAERRRHFRRGDVAGRRMPSAGRRQRLRYGPPGIGPSGFPLGRIGSNPDLLGAWKWKDAGRAAGQWTREFFNNARANWFERGDMLAHELEDALLRAPSWSEIVGRQPSELSSMAHSIAASGQGAAAMSAPERALALHITGLSVPEFGKPVGPSMWWWVRDFTHGYMAWFDELRVTSDQLERIQTTSRMMPNEILYGTMKHEGTSTLGYRQKGETGLRDKLYKLSSEQRAHIGKMVEDGRLEELRAVLPGEADAIEKGELAQRYPRLAEYLTDRQRMYQMVHEKLVAAGALKPGQRLENYFAHTFDHDTIMADYLASVSRKRATIQGMPAGLERTQLLKDLEVEQRSIEILKRMDPDSHVRETFNRYSVPKQVQASFTKERSLGLPGYTDDGDIVDSLYFKGAARILALRESLPIAQQALDLVDGAKKSAALTYRKRSPWTGALKVEKRPIDPRFAKQIHGWFDRYFGKGEENAVDATFRHIYEDLSPAALSKPLMQIQPTSKFRRFVRDEAIFWGSYDNFTQSLKHASYLGMLGLDPSFAIINLTQTPLNTVPMIGLRYTMKGVARTVQYHLDLNKLKSMRSALASYKIRGGLEVASKETAIAALEARVRPVDDLFRSSGIFTEAPLHEVGFLDRRLRDPRHQNMLSWLSAAGSVSETANRQFVALGTLEKYRDAVRWIQEETAAGRAPTKYPAQFRSLDGYNDARTAIERVSKAVADGRVEDDALEAAFEATRNSQFSYSQASGSAAAQASQAASLALLYKSFFAKTFMSFYPRLDLAQRMKFLFAHLAVGGPASVPVMSWVAQSLPNPWLKNQLEKLSLNGIEGNAELWTGADGKPVRVDERLPDWLFLEDIDPETGAKHRRLPLSISQLIGWADLPQRVGSGFPLAASGQPRGRFQEGHEGESVPENALRLIGGIPASNAFDAAAVAYQSVAAAIRANGAQGPLPVREEYQRRLSSIAEDAKQNWLDARGYEAMARTVGLPAGRNLSKLVRVYHEGRKLKSSGGSDFLNEPLTNFEIAREALGFKTSKTARKAMLVRELLAEGESQKLSSSTIDRRWLRSVQESGETLPSSKQVAQLQATYETAGLPAPKMDSAVSKFIVAHTPVEQSMLEQDRSRAAAFADRAEEFRAAGNEKAAIEVEGSLMSLKFESMVRAAQAGDEAAAQRGRELFEDIKLWSQRYGTNPIAGISTSEKHPLFGLVNEVRAAVVAAHRETGDWEEAGNEVERRLLQARMSEAQKKAARFFVPIVVDTYQRSDSPAGL